MKPTGGSFKSWIQRAVAISLALLWAAAAAQTADQVAGIASNSNGTFTLRFSGVPESQCYVVSASNVTSSAAWSVVPYSTNIITAMDGVWACTVSNTWQRQQFYRPVSINPCPPSTSYLTSCLPYPPLVVSGAYGVPGASYFHTEADYMKGIDTLATNGWIGQGQTWIAIDDCFGYRTNADSPLSANLAVFPSGSLSNLVFYAHQRGLKVRVYASTKAGTGHTDAGNATSGGHIIQDALVYATNWCVDGIKFEGWNSDPTGEAYADELFEATMLSAMPGKKFWFAHGSVNGVGPCGSWLPWVPYWGSTLYSGPGNPPAQDPDAHTWTQFFYHVAGAASFSEQIRPGFFNNFELQFLDTWENPPILKAWAEASIMFPSPWTTSSLESAGGWWDGVRQYWTNLDMLGLLWNPYISGARAALTTNDIANNVTNTVYVRDLDWPQGTNKAVWFTLQSTNTATTLVLPLTNLVSSVSTNVWTFYNPLSHAIEIYATNFAALTLVGPTSQLYKASAGYLAPTFQPGLNYADAFNWTATSTNGWNWPMYGVPLRKNQNQSSNEPNAPILLNGVVYSHGLSMCAPAWITFPLGGVVGSFSGIFGLEDRVSGCGESVQITIYVDGLQQWQSGNLTAAGQATNFTVNTAGANFLSIQLTGQANGLAGNYLVGDIGNAQFFVPGP